jgi:hypothetical protein
MVEAPCQIVAGSLKAFGLSGSPVWSFSALRVVSAGLTLIGLGATVTLLDGATYAQGISFSLGSTSTGYLQTGDILCLTTSVANTAVTQAQVTLALKHTQDVVTYFGVQP